MEQSVNNSMSDTELFDMLFGVQQQQQNKQNNNDNQDSPSSPVNSTMSEPANHHGMIERWEPGEILDSDFEMNSSFSTSSMTTSPQHYRSSHHHHQRPRRITDVCFVHDGIRKAAGGKKRGPRPKLLTSHERKQKRMDANDRERQRMGQLNVAFNHLRNVLPKHGNDRELSKYETVHLAKNYIRSLNEMLSETEASGNHQFQ